MFINIGACGRSEITTDDICTIAFDGNVLEENAYRQYMALQIGKPYSFSEEEVAACRGKLRTDSSFKRTWDHFYAKLEAGS